MYFRRLGRWESQKDQRQSVARTTQSTTGDWKCAIDTQSCLQICGQVRCDSHHLTWRRRPNNPRHSTWPQPVPRHQWWPIKAGGPDLEKRGKKWNSEGVIGQDTVSFVMNTEDTHPARCPARCKRLVKTHKTPPFPLRLLVWSLLGNIVRFYDCVERCSVCKRIFSSF